jgi:hypothetical protein
MMSLKTYNIGSGQCVGLHQSMIIPSHYSCCVYSEGRNVFSLNLMDVFCVCVVDAEPGKEQLVYALPVRFAKDVVASVIPPKTTYVGSLATKWDIQDHVIRSAAAARSLALGHTFEVRRDGAGNLSAVAISVASRNM